MNKTRLNELLSQYPSKTIAVVGDICLDRYFEIDPARQEISLETGLPAHQVVQVRAQPGGAGCVMGNVVAAGTGKRLAVSFCGDDGEGSELRRGLEAMGVDLRFFLTTPERHTFTYGKPLVIHPDRPAEELSRLDIKNWTPTPDAVIRQVIDNLTAAVAEADAVICMEQVDHRDTGVLPKPVKDHLARLAAKTGKTIVADSRCAIDEYTNVSLKINRSELMRHFDRTEGDEAPDALVAELTAKWAAQTGRNVIITLGADGILAAEPDGTLHRASKIPVAGEIDITGAGDCVLANLTLALAAGATLGEAIRVANLAANVVVKKLGTTGSASPDEINASLDALGGQYQ